MKDGDLTLSAVFCLWLKLRGSLMVTFKSWFGGNEHK